MTTGQRTQPTASSAGPRAVLRGNCMGAAVLIIVELAVGTAVNLYVSVPAGKSFFPAVFGSVLLAVHAVVAVALLGAAISAFVRSIRSRTAVAFTSAGLAAVLAAAIAGATFVGNTSNGASLAMALAAAVAMFCYLAAVFSIR
jgi:hypothetical protein